MTWGDDGSGGDSRDVQDQLNSAQWIQASCSSFAAVQDDRSLVTWGNSTSGGDSRSVQGQLKDAQQTQGSRWVFPDLWVMGLW